MTSNCYTFFLKKTAKKCDNLGTFTQKILFLDYKKTKKAKSVTIWGHGLYIYSICYIGSVFLYDSWLLTNERKWNSKSIYLESYFRSFFLSFFSRREFSRQLSIDKNNSRIGRVNKSHVTTQSSILLAIAPFLRPSGELAHILLHRYFYATFISIQLYTIWNDQCQKRTKKKKRKKERKIKKNKENN